jgi:nucleotide-binding universal stress UspA family protein
MFKHILVPTDFSDTAQHALEVGLELAKRFDAKVSILHAYQFFVPVAYAEAIVMPFDEIAARAKETLAKAVAAARERYGKCEGVLRPGQAADEILEVARGVGADLIVMGTHGRRGMSRLIMGSTAERVVRSAQVPVMTVGARAAALH